MSAGWGFHDLSSRFHHWDYPFVSPALGGFPFIWYAFLIRGGSFTSTVFGFCHYRRRLSSGDGPFVSLCFRVSITSLDAFPRGMVRLCPLVSVFQYLVGVFIRECPIGFPWLRFSVKSVGVSPPGMVRPYPLVGGFPLVQ